MAFVTMITSYGVRENEYYYQVVDNQITMDALFAGAGKWGTNPKVLPTVQALFPNAQIFISTHSPFIIASADDAWIYPLHLDGQQGVIGAPLESKIGASYATVLRDVLGVDSEFGPQVYVRQDPWVSGRYDAV